MYLHADGCNRAVGLPFSDDHNGLSFCQTADVHFVAFQIEILGFCIQEEEDAHNLQGRSSNRHDRSFDADIRCCGVELADAQGNEVVAGEQQGANSYSIAYRIGGKRRRVTINVQDLRVRNNLESAAHHYDQVFEYGFDRAAEHDFVFDTRQQVHLRSKGLAARAENHRQIDGLSRYDAALRNLFAFAIEEYRVGIDDDSQTGHGHEVAFDGCYGACDLAIAWPCRNFARYQGSRGIGYSAHFNTHPDGQVGEFHRVSERIQV